MFDKLRKNFAASRLIEEKYYEIVLDELAQGVKQKGIWGKALADSEGVLDKAESLYIKYRVQSLKDELELIDYSSTKNKHNEQLVNNIAKNEALKILSDRGYRAKVMPFGWKVTQPQGGWLEINSTPELIKFAKNIERYKIKK